MRRMPITGVSWMIASFLNLSSSAAVALAGKLNISLYVTGTTGGLAKHCSTVTFSAFSIDPVLMLSLSLLVIFCNCNT